MSNARKRDVVATLDAGYRTAHALIKALPTEWYDVGCSWYTVAHSHITRWSQLSGYSELQVSGVLANYNRNQSWGGSKTLTEEALLRGKVRGMGEVRRAVHGILALPVNCTHDDVMPWLTNGSKTRHFYWSCLDIAGCPCDRHIFAVWALPQSERYYPIVEEGCTMVARDLGVTPRQAEAIIWLARGYSRGRTMAQYAP